MACLTRGSLTADLSVSPARPAAAADLRITAAVTVENVGARAGDEVVQLYLTDREASCRVPQRDLRGFRRLHLAPGESRRLEFPLTARDLSLIDERGRRQLEPGRFLISVGGSQPDERSAALTGTRPARGRAAARRRPARAPVLTTLLASGAPARLPAAY